MCHLPILVVSLRREEAIMDHTTKIGKVGGRCFTKPFLVADFIVELVA